MATLMQVYASRAKKPQYYKEYQQEYQRTHRVKYTNKLCEQKRIYYLWKTECKRQLNILLPLLGDPADPLR